MKVRLPVHVPTVVEHVKSVQELGLNMKNRNQCRLTIIIPAMEQAVRPLAWSDRPLTGE
jgi:hypothetical protein